ncbi:MAG: hypothetical protein PHC31_04845 [Clostridia bacterium]|nr:hypothetical protein [Clostridia bacterium]MDD3092642.1 hypothetical protein [Clostridia bacterium]MDD3971228.1 hypothetical protein [Clostridia bacterium]
MKIIQISDKHYFEIFEEYPLLSGTPEEIVRLIEEKYFDADMFVININYSSEKVYRSQNCGIQVLKLLRLINYNQHCIIYSFFSRDCLLEKNPHNLILFSPGVSYVQLPFIFSSLDFQSLSENHKAPPDLSAYIKAESILPDNRHFFANWWGVWQLWQVQKAIEKIPGGDKSDVIAQNFGNAYKEMNSYQGLLAKYLFGYQHEDITMALKAKVNSRNTLFENEKRIQSDIENEIEELKKGIEETDKELIIIRRLRDKIEQDKNVDSKLPLLQFIQNFVNQFSKESRESRIISETLNDFTQSIETSNQKINRNESYLQLLEEIKIEENRLNDIYRINNERINQLIDQQTSALSMLPYSEIFEKLKTDKPSIIYVDDQAEDGWAFIFKRIIYGARYDGVLFNVFIPQKEKDNEKIAQEIYQLVYEKKAKLLILDLRLKGEIGNNLNPRDISGIQVLEQLKQLHLPCPILITTASNKTRIYKQTFIHGATAFWTKEGLDEKYDINASVDNYFSFIDLVHTLCYSKEVNFMYNDFLSSIKKFIMQEAVFWWETKFWEDQPEYFNKNNVAEKGEILTILWQSFDDLQDRLKVAIQTNRYIQLDNKDISLIIIRMSQILELIHCTENNIPDSIAQKVICQFNLQNINDSNSITINTNRLHAIRNEAAHRFNVDFDKLKKYIELLFNYLHGGRYYESTHRFQLLPIGSHNLGRIAPVHDGKYHSKIIEIDRNSTHTKIILENPNLNLANNCNEIIINLKTRFKDYFFEDSKIQALKIGDEIEFVLNIHRQGQVVEGYYGKKANLLCNH